MRIGNLRMSNSILNSSNNKGFSLLELLIYIAIFAGIVLTIGAVLVTILSGRDASNARFETHHNLRFAAEKIRQLVYDATSISTLGTCPLNTLRAVSGAVTTDVYASSGALTVNAGAGPEAITVSAVTVDTQASCMFAVTANPAPAKPTLQFDLRVRYNDNGDPASMFSDSVRTTVSRR